MTPATLGTLQKLLSDVYDVDVRACVEDYICDERVARTVAGAAADRGELLLIAQDTDEVSVGLYIREEAVRDLERPEARPQSLRLALEGVSHFVYFMFRAERGLSVTQLELELQAEVDNFVLPLFHPHLTGESRLRGRGVEIVREQSRRLRHHLYERVEYTDAADTEEGERYRLATRLAAQYASELERRYLCDGNFQGFTSELRRFYRLPSTPKLQFAEDSARR